MRGKKKKRVLSCLVLLFVLCICPIYNISASEAEQVKAQLVTDKEKYSDSEQIKATFTLEPDETLNDIQIKFSDLKGYTKKVTADNTNKSYQAVYTPEKKGWLASKTGDTDKWFLYLISSCIAAIFILIFMKKKKRFFSLFLIISVLLTAVPFSGKEVLADDTGKILTKQIIIGKETKEITVHYKYSVHMDTTVNGKKIKVDFESNGGTSVESQTINAGEKLTTPEEPTKEGYLFVGWFLDKDCTYIYDFKDYVPKQDGTLYALWVNLEDQTDTDGDGIWDSFEQMFGTDLNSTDTDGDGLPDAYELEPLGADPTSKDTDGNGVPDGTEDLDGDGLTNLEEYQFGTKPGYADSDNDGLSDYEEVKIYYTDPMKEDTDDDGASDGTEIKLGTDPLVADASFRISATCEGDGEITGVSVVTSVFGEQADSLEVQKNESEIFPSDMPGYLGTAYDFTIDGELASTAELKFTFDKKLADDPEFDPVVYYLNPETANLEPLDTIVDKTNGTATATTTHFSTYILLNRTKFSEVWKNDIRKPSDETVNGLSIAFVLDRSASMNDNDPDGIRLKLTKEFVQKMESGRDQGSLISFIAVDELITPLTDDLDQLSKDIDSIYNDSGWNYDSGTNGSAGIHTGLQQLKGDTSGNDRVILFMTDGDDTYVSYDYNQLIQEANDNKVTIYTIGLGQVEDTILKKVAEETGGKYYYAEEAEDLESIFKKTEEDTIDFVTDSNNDALSDYYTKYLCNAGPYVNGVKNPFSGLNYETVQASADCDSDGLLNGEEYHVDLLDDETIVFVMKSDPTKQDSDNDGLLDNSSTLDTFGNEIAPKDPQPLTYNGERNVWKSHIEAQLNAGAEPTDKYKPVATDYMDTLSLKGEIPGQYEQVCNCIEIAAAWINDCAINEKPEKLISKIHNIAFLIKFCTTQFPLKVGELIDGVINVEGKLAGCILGDDAAKQIAETAVAKESIAYIQAILGGKLLNFVPDNKNVALHSHPHTWQRALGYNDLYDLAFNVGSKMKKDYFSSNDKNYRIWIWKGDYWNLRSGAEIGLYVLDKESNGYTDTPIFDAIDYEVPMRVSLYNYESNSVKDNVFNWNPSIDQWWGTGFNWRYTEPDFNKMIMVGSICLKKANDLYYSFKNSIADKHFIFDDATTTIWIQW